MNRVRPILIAIGVMLALTGDYGSVRAWVTFIGPNRASCSVGANGPIAAPLSRSPDWR